MENNLKPKLLLLGGSGFIGSLLAYKLIKEGWQINLLTRNKLAYQISFPCNIYKWNGVSIPKESLLGIKAIINLSGQSVADGWWTKKYKKAIYDSRIQSARALVAAVLEMQTYPDVIIQASAVGYYGYSKQEITVDESSSVGSDFLAQTCKDWEQEIEKISDKTRVCIVRIGVVLGEQGGAFPKLWEIYFSGLGAVLGSGRQHMNFIHIKDVVNFFSLALKNDSYTGIYNLVAPKDINNKDFHKILCKKTISISRLFVPAFILKILFGEKSSILLDLPSVKPKRLLEQKFNFEFPEADKATKKLTETREYNRANYLVYRQWLPVSLDKMWSFVSQAENLERITPPWLNFKIKSVSDKKIKEKTLIKYELRLYGIKFSWLTKICKWEPKNKFADQQEKGPYNLWHHTHLFEELAGGVLIEDKVSYRLPFFPIGQIAFPLVKKEIGKIFSYREKALADIFSED
jgi:uncharacterized protein